MTVPFVCVLVAWLLVFVPRMFVAAAQARMPEGYDNAHPRDQQSRLEGWGKRAQGAHLNGFEAFAPFAAAVIIAHLAHASESRATQLAIAFVVLRAVYIGLYLANLDKVRSLVWIAAFAANGALFVLPWIG